MILLDYIFGGTVVADEDRKTGAVDLEVCCRSIGLGNVLVIGLLVTAILLIEVVVVVVN